MGSKQGYKEVLSDLQMQHKQESIYFCQFEQSRWVRSAERFCGIQVNMNLGFAIFQP
jgi:hypothetical protein